MNTGAKMCMNLYHDSSVASKYKCPHLKVGWQCCSWKLKVQNLGIQQASENISSTISFRASSPSQKLGAIGPGIAPQGDVSACSCRVAGISQQHTLPGFVAFFAHCTDPFRNSAETADTSLDCRCSSDLSLHVDLLASSLRFWSPFPSSSAPGGCQRWLKGLPGGFKGPFNPSSRS